MIRYMFLIKMVLLPMPHICGICGSNCARGTASKWMKRRGEVEKKFKWVPKFKRGPKDIFPRGDLTLEWDQEFIRGAENL